MNLLDLERIDPAALAKSFPPDFRWGVATSAAQIEGAAFEDGKGASIWDHFCRQPGRIKDGSNIDVACDHYHRFREDVALMKGLGLDCYRFSFAWPRVQPLGQGAWNEAGFAFYDRLIDSLLEAGIQPHATLYHWDLPQALDEQLGGWLSRDVVARFADYAAEVARRFGSRLASIATHNEPWCTATLGYETAQFAPGHTSRAESLQVAHHLMLSHGDAVAAMRAVTKAPLGIVLNHTPSFPATPNEADRRAARIDDGLNVRWYMDPIFRGAYPADALEHVGADAPRIAAGDLERIRQPLDFLGINFYTRSLFGADGKTVKGPGKRGFTDMGWEIVPEVFAQHLVRLAREYNPPPMFITENGMANADSVVAGPQPHVPDVERIAYLSAHLQALSTAMSLGADVRGYFYWSLLDNFEWNSGYDKRFGLVHVDYRTLERLPKDSARWYRDFIAEHRARR
ncbi:MULTISPECIES: GH1 family beta-glucosidase [Roseateles]|uniref:Beta-glucosidase n=1 Tax=Pelomonas caseinilytica TaxID=2906763 RepID=A0ABS8XFC9_9BURK|nr:MULTISPECIES: GH1 family beta-glucosidase [unclassified Roseateles]MCE4539604.1 GH1 family beta-glucosidase [Pelomonas sp. P7]HEV6964905.1 GH1 family beta-glucosidase [Roseateles sp.]